MKPISVIEIYLQEYKKNKPMNKLEKYIKENFDNPKTVKKLLKIAKFHHTGLKDLLGKEIYNGDNLIVCNGSINGIKWKDKPYEVKYKLNGGFNLPFFCWNKKGGSIMDRTHYCLKKTDKKIYYIELTEFGILPKTLFYSNKGATDFKNAYFTEDKDELQLFADKMAYYKSEICEL